MLHSETSDFHFLVVCATFFSFLFEQGFRCTWMMDGVGACCPGSRGPRAESRGPRAGPPFIQCLFHKLLMKHHPHHPPLLSSSRWVAVGFHDLSADVKALGAATSIKQ